MKPAAQGVKTRLLLGPGNEHDGVAVVTGEPGSGRVLLVIGRAKDSTKTPVAMLRMTKDEAQALVAFLVTEIGVPS